MESSVGGQQHDSAVAYVSKSLELVAERIPADHAEMRHYYNAAYLVNLSAGNHQSALEYAEKNLEIRKRYFSDRPAYVKLGYAAMSSAYNAMGNFEQGLGNQKISYELALEAFGMDNPSTGLDAANLAFSYYRVEDFEKALIYQQQALDVFAKTYKPNHFLVVRGNIRMGIFHLARFEITKSREYRNKATLLLEQIDPENRRDLPEMLNDLNSEITAFEK